MREGRKYTKVCGRRGAIELLRKKPNKLSMNWISTKQSLWDTNGNFVVWGLDVKEILQVMNLCVSKENSLLRMYWYTFQ